MITLSIGCVSGFERLPDFPSQISKHVARLLAPALQRFISVLRQAHVAGNASDALLTFGKSGWQVGLANEGPGQRKEIGIAGINDIRHDVRGADAADQDHRRVADFLELASEGPIVGLRA
jgi:hypothetical protein